jgi:hypothetical protein
MANIIHLMKKLLIILTALCILSPVTTAQLWKAHRLEISGGLGTTQFFGDIGGYPNQKNILGIRDFTFMHTRINVNTNLRYRIAEDFAVRANLTAGIFHSTDARGSFVNRRFEETTQFFEPSLIAEYYFIKNREENSYLFVRDNLTFIKSIIASLDFYAFAGFGVLAYHVKPNNVLSPLVTKSGGFTEVVPVGIGVTVIYSSRINLGVEFGGRFTYSDNLDGYTSPTSHRNDVYHSLNFMVTYKLKTGEKKGGGPVFGR